MRRKSAGPVPVKRELKHFRIPFRQALSRHYSLRLHMMAMLLAMFALGAVTSWALRHAGLDSMGLRYPVVTAAAYVGFLCFVRLWIALVRERAHAHPSVPEAALVAAVAAQQRRPHDDGMADDVIEAAGEVTEAAVDGSFDLGDGEGVIVVIVVGVVLLALLGLGAYAVWEAPAILGDALFQAALAGAVRRSVVRADVEHWLASIWRATFWMFWLAVVLSAIAGVSLDAYCPTATTAVQAFQCAP